MKPESLKLFAKLMEKGYISHEQDPSYYEDYCHKQQIYGCRLLFRYIHVLNLSIWLTEIGVSITVFSLHLIRNTFVLHTEQELTAFI